jgi:hypothetical protein
VFSLSRGPGFGPGRVGGGFDLTKPGVFQVGMMEGGC